MYMFHKQAHPPTVVEESLYCRFFDFSERNLVVAGNNLLKVYRLVAEPSSTSPVDGLSPPSGEQREENEEEQQQKQPKVKLECLQSFHVFGSIVSMQSVNLSGSTRDSLLLCFPEAKLSVVEYDPTTHDLKTLSLHYFEEEDMKVGRTQFPHPPILRVDPNGRCAAMLAYGTNIVILPFRKDIIAVDEPDVGSTPVKPVPEAGTSAAPLSAGVGGGPVNAKTPVMASYKLNLHDEHYAGEKINNIIDMQFLQGYYEPTLLIVHEPVRTWSGRVAVRQETCAMVALSLNVHQRVHPIIWSISHLPYDCFQALPVPRPVGGVLIFAVNSLIYLNQSVPPYAVSLNSFASDTSSSLSMDVQKGAKLSLDCSKACFIANDKLVVSLKDGELYVVTLFNDGMRSIKSFHFDKVAASVLTSCMTLCEEGYLFLGSRLGNSLLLKYTEKPFDSVAAALKETQRLEKIKAEVPAEDDDALKMHVPEVADLTQSDQISTINDVLPDEEMVLTEEIVHEVGPVIKIEAVEEDSPSSETHESDETKTEEPPTKKLKEEDAELPQEESEESPVDEPGGDIGQWMAGDVALMKDQDELEVYGVEEKAEEKLPTVLTFEVCDSIVNIGPCGRISMGEPAFLADEFSGNPDPQVELVTTSGYGKNGALCLIQRSIRPQIVTTFELPYCTDMWTVFGPPEKRKDTQELVEGLKPHAFLILSRQDSTMILQTGQEINELDQSGFSSQTATLFAGNLGDNQYILQVSPTGVSLLDGTRQVQHITLKQFLGTQEAEEDNSIVHASLADPYAVLMTRNGVIIQLRLDSGGESARLFFSKPNLSTAKSRIATFCVYKDTSALFTTDAVKEQKPILEESEINAKVPQHSSNKLNIAAAAQISSLAATVDDEDELLYGDSTVEQVASLDDIVSSKVLPDDETCEIEVKPKPYKSNVHVLKDVSPTFWLFVARDNGVLEIYSLQGFKLVYYVKNFPMGPKVLVDSVQSTDPNAQQDSLFSLPAVREILVTGMGLKQSRPILFSRFDGEIFIYEAFPFYETKVDNHLKLRFKRMNFNVILRDPSQTAKADTEAEASETNSQDGSVIIEKEVTVQKWFRSFGDISGYAGVFMCGPYPHWFFMTSRGELRVHEMSVDGPVTCFATFHNVNCHKGFLYFNKQEDLRIAVLSTQVSYDAPWPVRKVPLQCTAHFVNYHLDRKCYCVVTSSLEVYNKIVRVGGDEKDYEFLERDNRYIWPTTEKFSIQLFSPVSWDMIPGTKIEFDEWEHVTCLKNVMLVSEGTESGLKGYIAVGTNYCYGEDVTNRGRIWILDIIEVVPEPGQPLTRNKIKIAYCKEQKGPVTALCQVKGFLLSAIGQKVYIWQLKESSLVGVAFIDTQIYIHSAVSIKNLVLVADVYKSVSLLRYQEETRTLALVSRDTRSFQVYGCEFLIHNNMLCFVVSDVDKNLIVYSYQPELRESYGGTRLIRRADIHLGSHVNHFFRIKCKPLYSGANDALMRKETEQRHVTMFATLDGSLGFVLPVSEKIYRRLLMLQNVMTTQIQHLAGLNPKAYRLYKPDVRALSNPCRNILDGDLLWKFLTLSMNERAELAKKIGTTTDQILDDLQEIDRVTANF